MLQVAIFIISIPASGIMNSYNVVAFTAAQIPDIDGRKYPKELAGKLYPDGIPIFAEENLPDLIKKYKVNDCIFSYSDVPYQKVMSVSAIVNAAGANFVLLGPDDTMVKSTKPVIAVGAIRTGCGKSQTSRKVIEILMDKGLKVVAVRHPMPYGDLNAQSAAIAARANGSSVCRAVTARGARSTPTTNIIISTIFRSPITARYSTRRPKTSPRAACRCWRN